MRAAPLPLGRDKEEVDRRRGGALYTHARARTTACTRRRGHTPPSWPAPPVPLTYVATGSLSSESYFKITLKAKHVRYEPVHRHMFIFTPCPTQGWCGLILWPSLSKVGIWG